MGARVTKNLSGDIGSEIVGKIYELYNNCEINECHHCYSKYYIKVNPGSCSKPTRIIVRGVYFIRNVPDAGDSICIHGDAEIDGDKSYSGVNLVALFDHCDYEVVQKYLNEPNYEQKISPRTDLLKIVGESMNQIDTKTIPLIKKSREELIIVYGSLSLFTLNNDTLKKVLLDGETGVLGELDIDNLTDWDLELKIQQMYSPSHYQPEYLKYDED